MGRLAWNKSHGQAASWVAVFPFRLPANLAQCTRGCALSFNTPEGEHRHPTLIRALNVGPCGWGHDTR